MSSAPVAEAGPVVPVANGHAAGDELGAFLRAARAHAAALAGTAVGGPGETFVAAVSFAADVVRGLALEHPPTRAEADELVASAVEAVEADPTVMRAAVCSRALRDPQLLELPPALAAEAVLRIPRGRACRSRLALGPHAPRRCASRSRARRHAGGPTVPRRRASGPPRRRGRRWKPGIHRRFRCSALAAAGRGARRPCGGRRRCHGTYPRARGSRRPRQRRRPGSSPRARGVARALPRRGRRATARAGRVRPPRRGDPGRDRARGDVRLLRAQLADLVPASHRREIAEGRVDDLQARLVAIEAELRSVTRSLEPSTLARTPLAEALTEQVSAFGRKSDIRTTAEARGDFGDMTPSQRIALVRIVQESLTNARDHGEARSVRVSVWTEHDGVHAEITDDGRGFDVERTVVEAAPKGRLGLVGMSERVRLLGGRFDITSRPGGPTTVAVAFPPWKPVTAARDRLDEAIAAGAPAGPAAPVPLHFSPSA